MSFGQVEGFFVDACVLLPHSSASTRKSCIAFLKEHVSRCMLCSSVKDEAFSLIDQSYTIILHSLSSDLKLFLQKEGIQELTNRNGTILADFFAEQKRSMKITLPTRSNVRNEIMGEIEDYVASRLHSMKDGFKTTIEDFIASLMVELAITEHDLKAPFTGLKTVDIKPDNSITSLIILRALIGNPKDVEHLSSALIFQFRENKWVIFVTIDETDILSKQKEMLDVFALQCSKPEWASDYYHKMTRLKSPVEHFREIKNHTEKQKEFGNTMEKALDIRILS